MKKVLSILLTAAMLLALFVIVPTSAGAAPEDSLVWRYALTPDEDAVISAPLTCNQHLTHS